MNTSNPKDTDRIPREFCVEEIQNDLSYTNVVILKWKKQIDDRPLYVESALILRDTHYGYELTHIYRHPLQWGRIAAPWEGDFVYEVLRIPIVSSESMPTKKI